MQLTVRGGERRKKASAVAGSEKDLGVQVLASAAQLREGEEEEVSSVADRRGIACAPLSASPS